MEFEKSGGFGCSRLTQLRMSVVQRSPVLVSGWGRGGRQARRFLSMDSVPFEGACGLERLCSPTRREPKGRGACITKRWGRVVDECSGTRRRLVRVTLGALS